MELPPRNNGQDRITNDGAYCGSHLYSHTQPTRIFSGIVAHPPSPLHREINYSGYVVYMLLSQTINSFFTFLPGDVVSKYAQGPHTRPMAEIVPLSTRTLLQRFNHFAMHPTQCPCPYSIIKALIRYSIINVYVKI